MASTIGTVTYGIAYGAKVSTAVGMLGMAYTCLRPFFPLVAKSWPLEAFESFGFDFDFGLGDQRAQAGMSAMGLEIPTWITTSAIGILSSTIGCVLKLK